MAKQKAVVLVSGGLDSATCLAIAKKKDYELYALTLSYGQRHQAELKAAKRVAKAFGVKKHLVLEVPLGAFGGSALTDKKIRVPKNRGVKQIGKGIPPTYVPARNTVFLSLALAWAEVLEARHIHIGVNALDYSGYPDCRPGFIRAFEKLARLATKGGSEGKWKPVIHTPLIRMTKAQIIRTGLKLGVDYSLTHSCYDPTNRGGPCGRCDSCLIRAKGFRQAGVPDPAGNKSSSSRFIG
jgi:7-cyano-7-deazaguanine synthase